MRGVNSELLLIIIIIIIIITIISRFQELVRFPVSVFQFRRIFNGSDNDTGNLSADKK
jgi:hypothetical protein